MAKNKLINGSVIKALFLTAIHSVLFLAVVDYSSAQHPLPTPTPKRGPLKLPPLQERERDPLREMWERMVQEEDEEDLSAGRKPQVQPPPPVHPPLIEEREDPNRTVAESILPSLGHRLQTQRRDVEATIREATAAEREAQRKRDETTRFLHGMHSDGRASYLDSQRQWHTSIVQQVERQSDLFSHSIGKHRTALQGFARELERCQGEHNHIRTGRDVDWRIARATLAECEKKVEDIEVELKKIESSITRETRNLETLRNQAMSQLRTAQQEGRARYQRER